MSSAQIFDRNCHVCKEDGTVSKAICYCTVCYQYFCTPCRDFHNKFHRDHRDKLLDRVAMLIRPFDVALTTTCEAHGDELVQMYCYDHDVVCCAVCLAINHEKCTNIEYIPNIADGFSNDPDVDKTKSDLHDVLTELVTIQSSRQIDQMRLKKEMERALVQVEDSRRKVNAVFDRLEEVVLREVDERYESFGKNIQTDLNACENVISKLEKTIRELEDTDTQPEEQVFIHVKNGAQNIEEWRTIVSQIQYNIGLEKIEFVINGDIQDYLDKLDNLGTFVDEMRETSQRRTVIHEDIRGKLMANADTFSETSEPQRATSKEDVGEKLMTNADTLKEASPSQRVAIEEGVRGKLRANEDTLKGASQTGRVSREGDVYEGEIGTYEETSIGDSQPQTVISEKNVRAKLDTLKGDSQPGPANTEDDDYDAVYEGAIVTYEDTSIAASQPKIMISEDDVRRKLGTLKGASQPQIMISEDDVRRKLDKLKGASQTKRVNREEDGYRRKLGTDEDTSKGDSQPQTVISQKNVRAKLDTLKGDSQPGPVNSEDDDYEVYEGELGTYEDTLKGASRPQIMISEDVVRRKLGTLKGASQPQLMISEDDVRRKLGTLKGASQPQIMISEDDVKRKLGTLKGASQPQLMISEDDVRRKLGTLKGTSQPQIMIREDDVNRKLGTLKGASQPQIKISEDDVRRKLGTLKGASQPQIMISEDDVRQKLGALKGAGQPQIMISEDDVRRKLGALKGASQPLIMISEEDVRRKLETLKGARQQQKSE